MLISIEQITVSDRIRKDFGNIEELAADIRDNGLINPPVVTPEYHLIAGERRLRAMKHLGYQQVEVRVMTVKDYEHLLNLEINENESRKEFTKSERIEYARRLEQIERLKAKERMENPIQNFGQGSKTEDNVASKLGIGSGEQYRKEKFIADNADSETLEAWNSGDISTHKAYVTLKQQNELLERQLEAERTKPPQVVEKVVEKAPDWLIKQADEARALKMEAQRLEEQVKALEKEKARLDEKLKLTAKEAAETEELKRNIARLQQHSEETMNRWRAIDELATMVSQIEHLISGKLAPTRYSLALTELADNPTVMENVSRIVATVQGWCNEMNTVIRNSKIVEVETYE